MAIPKLTPLSTPAPTRSDPVNFPERGDVLMTELPPMVSQLNLAIDNIDLAVAEVESASLAAFEASEAAASSAAAALSVSGATAWVSGQTYAINTCTISQVNFQTYRKRTSAAGNATDPANNSTDWTLLIRDGAFIPQAQSSATFDLSRGNYFKRTVTANETWNFTNCPMDGYSWTVEVEHTGGVVSMPAAVKTPNNIAYTLTSGKTHLFMFVTSNKGVRIRMSVAPNFDT